MEQPDLDEIVAAMETSREMGDCFLDTVTGEVVHIPLEVQRNVEAEAEGGEAIWDLPDWQKELIPIAEGIYRGDSRWARIPEVSSREIYEEMADFAATVQDERLRELLELALDGPGAFRRFKDVLARFPGEQERWSRRKRAYLEQSAREWLADLEEPEWTS